MINKESKIIPCRYGYQGSFGVISFNLGLINKEHIIDQLKKDSSKGEDLICSSIDIIDTLRAMVKLGIGLNSEEEGVFKLIIQSIYNSIRETGDFSDSLLETPLDSWLKRYYIANCFWHSGDLLELSQIPGYLFTGERWQGPIKPLLTLEELVYKTFSINCKYPYSEIEDKLGELYKLCDIGIKASPEDIRDYFNVEGVGIIKEGNNKVEYGYKIIAKK